MTQSSLCSSGDIIGQSEICRSFGNFDLFIGGGICLFAHAIEADGTSHWRYVLKIHFFIESGLKMIQFKIQFKTKSRIFIQQNIQ